MSVKDTLIKYDQKQLVAFSKNWSDAQKRTFLKDYREVDFELCQKLFYYSQENFPEKEVTIEPLPPVSLQEASNAQKEEWETLGLEALREGKVAAFLLAGGQGSRLGFEGPKGMYSIGLPGGESLFELQAQRLLSLSNKVGTAIPWAIMTSRLNEGATRDFFKRYGNFGYDEEDLYFFNQGMIPAMDFEGKILLNSPATLALVPDGNGGCFKALADSGVLTSLGFRGVESLFVYGVDNALVRPCDPLFVGFHLQSGHPTTSKVVRKKEASEKVGLFVNKDGLPGVVEYSDLKPGMAEETDATGQLRYRGANIATHLFQLKSLQEVAKEPLPYHTARKKVPFYNAQGILETPAEPNALKFEQFLFDIFPRLGSTAILEVKREAEFAPVKNAEGNDSPASARKMLLDLHRQWLEDSGYTLDEGKEYQVHPYWSLDGDFQPHFSLEEAIDKNLIKIVE